MKAITLLMLTVQLCFYPRSNLGFQFKMEKKFSFGKYTVITGTCDKGSAALIEEDGRTIFSTCGGDGLFLTLDTMNINNDNKPDFIFSYAFDDYTTLGMYVSSSTGGKYRSINITDNVYKDHNCSVEPFNVNDERIRDFIIYDYDNDGEQDIITIAIKNPDLSVSLTQCSIIIYHKQLLNLLN